MNGRITYKMILLVDEASLVGSGSDNIAINSQWHGCNTVDLICTSIKNN